MNAVRLRQIEEIYQIAADSVPDQRAAIVDNKCGGDQALRQEVEILLSYDEISESFIDSSPDAIAAEMFAEEKISSPLIGTTVGHYQIQRLIGEGGMGEVYLADDLQLNRKVAIKLVPPDILENKGRLMRFKQEAQAASALNHPNILTIHEFGTEDGSDYIVSEFVDGITLGQRIDDGPVPLEEMLDICVQVTSALAAADDAGIVHRDIKPDNIMIRHDGIIKILDFGLAKLMVPADAGQGSGLEAQTLFKTEPGVVMGTVAYMSPEQARGVNVDARTDIWSLGVIIYEMVSSHLPFTGPTKTDVLVSILNQPARMLKEFVKDAPDELDHIINRALAKKSDDRYQNVKDMASDLKNYRHKLEFEAEVQMSENNRRTVDNRWKGREETATQMMPAVSDTPPPSNTRHQRFSRTSILMLVILLVAAAGAGTYVWKTGLFDKPAEISALSLPPTVPTNTAGTPSLSLTYSLTVQSFTDGKYKDPFTLSGEMLFRNRDRIRLNIKSPQGGHLYILNRGPQDETSTAEYNILFPSPTANDGAAALAEGQEIQIPRQSWFELDAKEGTELVWLVWSVNALPELESAKRFANPVDRGRVKDIELNNTIASLLLQHQSNKAAVQRNDEKKETQITGNADIVAHLIKLEHH